MSKECGCGPVGENEIARYVRDAVNEYFRDLEGEHPSSSIYDMVVRCVEKPLIETVLHHLEYGEALVTLGDPAAARELYAKLRELLLEGSSA